MEYTHLMQTAIMDQSEEIRMVLLRLIIDEQVREPVFLMVLGSADSNKMVKQTASAYLETWFEVAHARQIANLLIHLMFFLKNSSGIPRREQFASIFCGYLNERSVGYAVEAA